MIYFIFKINLAKTLLVNELKKCASDFILHHVRKGHLLNPLLKNP